MLNKSGFLLFNLRLSRKLSSSLYNNMTEIDVRFSKLINFTFLKSDKYSTSIAQLKK